MEPHAELSTRPEDRFGTDEQWDEAEGALRKALERHGMRYVIGEGEGTFYGPKIDLHMTDVLGRSWQMGTIQYDMQMTARFGLTYMGPDNSEHMPICIHRALFGSFERFIGILIEHYAGAFPLWLAPHQMVVMNITERQAEYAASVKNKLVNQGFRAILDLRNEKISYKIREHSLQKLPYQVVVGDKEMQAETVAVRTRSGEDLGAMSLDAFTARLGSEMRAEAKAQ
jgi:threonyl-tRNA synthetase